jgi:hypothetical protein
MSGVESLESGVKTKNKTGRLGDKETRRKRLDWKTT